MDGLLPVYSRLIKPNNDCYITGGAVAYDSSMYSSVSKGVVFKIGGLGIVVFGASLKNSIAGTGTTLCTVPEGFRPLSNTSVICVGNYSITNGLLIASAGLSTNGKITTSFGSGTLSGAIWILTSVYSLLP